MLMETKMGTWRIQVEKRYQVMEFSIMPTMNCNADKKTNRVIDLIMLF